MSEAKIVIKRKNYRTFTIEGKEKKDKIRRSRGKRPDRKTFTKQVSIPEYNYMKYWRIVRYWALKKWEISQEELEILLYLYDEDVFTRDQFIEFEGLLSWDRDRFQSMQDKGWVIVWRLNDGFKSKKLYTLSLAAKRICGEIYKKLSQDEHISETHQNNPIFKGNGYMDRKYRKMIRMMNKKRQDALNEE